MEGKNMKKKLTTLVLIILMAVTAAACGGGKAAPKGTLSDRFEKADMSGYNCMADYQEDTVFYHVTVKDVEKMMKDKESFVLYTGFDNCPWCNVVLPVLNDMALEKSVQVAYIDTRKDSSWSSNMDIDDYDLFVKLMGDVIPKDDDGTVHLYVPHIFFVSQGELAGDHRGTVPSQSSHSDPLTDAQKTELEGLLRAGIEKTL